MNLEFVVTGMVCDGCSTTVEKVLSEMEGVTAQSVTLEGGAASVQHDDSVAPAAIYAAIRGSGFGVRTSGNPDCTCPNCECDPCGCTKEKACGCS